MTPTRLLFEERTNLFMDCSNQETWLEHYRFEKYLLDLCIVTLEQGGVTSNIFTRQFLPPIDAWCVPRYPEKTLILPPGSNLLAALKLFIGQHYADLRCPDTWLGTWIHPFTRSCHLDITEIYADLDMAREEALKRSRVLALYNSKHNQTVFLQTEALLINDTHL